MGDKNVMGVDQDKKPGSWWPYTPAQVKRFVVVLVTTCTAVGGTVWGMLEFMVEPMVDARVEVRLEEHDKKKASRWDTAGELLGVKGDVVPYKLKEIFVTVDSLVAGVHRFEQEYKPWLDEWSSRTILVRYLDDQGQEWWNWRDNRGHPVVEYEGGYSWIVYSSQKIYPIPPPKGANN